MFGRKRKIALKIPYDSANQRAVLRCSICTGEKVAGFRDLHTGKFTEVMLIQNDGDLAAFMETYGLKKITKEY